MPALRGVSAMAPRSRRRSSVFSPAKAGVYGVNSNAMSHLPPRPISFAPNVTPVTFNESSDSSSPSTPEPGSPNSHPKLFPPSETPAPPPARKRCPPGKRRSQGYIPRPPNAFMLFRADFVRQKHVPGSIETNHGSLSKIIGNCWRSLPLEEKRVWEQKAKHEKAAHKVQYPNYRFRPVHNKNKKPKEDASALKSGATTNTLSADKDKHQSSFEEEIRCEEVTQLLLEGKKGEELAQALRALEKRREIDIHSYRRSETPSTANSSSIPFGGIMSAPQPTYPSSLFANSTPLYLHRRSSSVPLPQPNNYDWSGDFYMENSSYSFNHELPVEPNSIALPSVPFLPPPSSAGISGLSAVSANGDSSMRPSFSLLSKQQRMMYGQRRSSSAGAAFGGIQRAWSNVNYDYEGLDGSFSWPAGDDVVLQRDESALPEVVMSFFNGSFLDPSLNATAPAPPTVMEDEAPGINTNATTTPNGAFNVSELFNGLPPQHSLGPLDTTGLSMNGPLGILVSPVDSNGSSSATYWNPHASSPGQHHHRQLSHPPQQAVVDGLQLEFAAAPAGAIDHTGAGQYDQIYLADQDQHAQYTQMMVGTGFDSVDPSYDMGAYMNASYVQHSQQNHQSYVEC